MSEHSIFHLRTTPHRGWGILESGGVALVVIVVIAVVLGGLYSLWGRKDVALEMSNLQTISTSAQGLLKGSNGYDFTSADTMTGTLIQVGGVPKSMTTQGDTSSGSATLWNAWGGQVMVTPVATNGFNNGFSVTYESVPQDPCISITTRMSAGGTVSGITINSTAHADGKVTAESAGKACTKDAGRTGQNKLVFSYNG